AIYFWVPFCNSRLQAKMERRIADQMKVGAIVCPFSCGYTIGADPRFKKISVAGHKDYYGGYVFHQKVSN
ncbi:MAG: hypothetical protein MN733_14695, partial [Nitrososphaera sp.]|nr:hypothetical protein [Nitrososphaera sp.]